MLNIVYFSEFTHPYVTGIPSRLFSVLCLTLSVALSGQSEAPACQAQANPADATALAAAGEQSLRDQRFDQAADCYRKLLATDPTASAARFSLGEAEFRGGHFPEAAKTLLGLLDREPGNGQAQELLALSYFNSHMYAAAAAALELVLKTKPADKELRLYLAQSLLLSSQASRALEVIQQLRAQEPDTPALRIFTARTLEQLGRLDDAIAEWKGVVEKFPAEPNVHYGIGYIYWTRHEDDEAESELKLETVQNPGSGPAWALLGDIAVRRNRPDDARPLIEKALSIDSSLQIARADLGVVLGAAKQYELAIAELQQAIRLDPKKTNPHLQLARVYHDAGREDDAKVEREAVRKLRDEEHQKTVSQYALSLVYRGDQLASSGNTDEAMDSYHKALDDDPDCAPAYSRIGELTAKSGKPDQAIEPLQKALSLNPGDTRARDSLAAALALSNGRSAEAIDFAQKALRQDPEDVALHVNLAIALYRAGRVDEAIEHLRQASQLRPNDATIESNLGTTLLGRGRIEEAIPHLERALDLRPVSAEMQYKVGELCYSRGMEGRAFAHWRQALVIDSNFTPALRRAVRTLSRSRDVSLRDVAEGARLAGRLARLADQAHDPAGLAVAAEAFAAAGHFSDALQTATEALQLATSAGDQTLIDQLNGDIAAWQAAVPSADQAGHF